MLYIYIQIHMRYMWGAQDWKSSRTKPHLPVLFSTVRHHRVAGQHNAKRRLHADLIRRRGHTMTTLHSHGCWGRLRRRQLLTRNINYSQKIAKVCKCTGIERERKRAINKKGDIPSNLYGKCDYGQHKMKANETTRVITPIARSATFR